MSNQTTIYHGSQQIIDGPKYGVGKPYNDYGMAFIAQRVWRLLKNGHARKKRWLC